MSAYTNKICFRKMKDGRLRPIHTSRDKGLVGPPAGIYEPMTRRRTSGVLRMRRIMDRFEVVIPPYTDNLPTEMAERLIRDFDHVPNSNVLITGKSGMGKTLTAQAVCNAFIDKGHIVLVVKEPIPTTILRQYVEAANGKEIVLLIDDMHISYKSYRGMDQFIAFLSDPLLKNCITIMTGDDDLRYTRMTVVDGRPSRTFYRLSLSYINTIKAEDLMGKVRTDLKKFKGKQNEWRLELFEELLKTKVRRTNFDALNHLVHILKTEPSKEQAESKLNVLNLNVMNGDH